MIPLYNLFHIGRWLHMQQTEPNNCVVCRTHKHQLPMGPKIKKCINNVIFSTLLKIKI